jgi:hypothetical protein
MLRASNIKVLMDMLNRREKAVIDENSLSGGGLMDDAQLDRFIELIQESTDIMKNVRIERVTAPGQKFNGLLVSGRQARNPGIANAYGSGHYTTEDQSQFLRGLSSYEFILNTEMLSLPYALGKEVLRDNIEGEGFEGKAMRAFSNVFSKDLEDQGINGNIVDRNALSPIATTVDGAHTDSVTTISVADASDFPDMSDPSLIEFPGYLKIVNGSSEVEYVTYTGKTGNDFTGCTRGATVVDTNSAGDGASAYTGGEAVTWIRHHLIGSTDGWLYKIQNASATEPAANLVDASLINSGVIDMNHFYAGLDAMPNKYMANFDERNLRWIMNTSTYTKLKQAIAVTLGGSGNLVDNIYTTNEFAPLGIPVLTGTMFPSDMMLLTDPMNLLVGIWKEVTFEWTAVGKSSLMEAKRFYRIDIRAGFEVERKDFCVLLTDFDVSSWVTV